MFLNCWVRFYQRCHALQSINSSNKPWQSLVGSLHSARNDLQTTAVIVTANSHNYICSRTWTLKMVHLSRPRIPSAVICAAWAECYRGLYRFQDTAYLCPYLA